MGGYERFCSGRAPFQNAPSGLENDIRDSREEVVVAAGLAKSGSMTRKRVARLPAVNSF